MNVEISSDPDGRVYVRWRGGGPYTVLDPDGTARQEVGLGGEQEWMEYEEVELDERGDYDDGYSDGHTAAEIEASEEAATEPKASA